MKLSKETIKEHVAILDQTNSDQTVDKDVYLYQTHQHSKSVENINQSHSVITLVVSLRIAVAVLLDQSVDILERSKILTKCNNIFAKSKTVYIQVRHLTVNEALKFLNIAEVDYYEALSQSPISDC